MTRTKPHLFRAQEAAAQAFAAEEAARAATPAPPVCPHCRNARFVVEGNSVRDCTCVEAGL
jgi:hypothetical protein